MSKSALAAAGLVIFLGGAACSSLGGDAAASPSGPSPTVQAPVRGKMDQPVPTPGGFPAAVPVYPGARLTAGASFPGTSVTTFGMEWETLDSVAKVHTFYAENLNQGGWQISFSGTTSTGFNAVFSRTDNTKETGVLGADGSSGVTKISLSLVAPA